MRQIQQLADAIVRIVEQVNNREYETALEAVDDVLDAINSSGVIQVPSPSPPPPPRRRPRRPRTGRRSPTSW